MGGGFLNMTAINNRRQAPALITGTGWVANVTPSRILLNVDPRVDDFLPEAIDDLLPAFLRPAWTLDYLGENEVGWDSYTLTREFDVY